METVIWVNEKFTVGVQHIDAQHKHIVEMLNTLGQAIEENRGTEYIAQVVSEMKSYAQYHFATEEEAMSKFNFPKLVAHRTEHDAFIEKVLDVEDALATGGQISPLDIWTFLRDWVTDHIQSCDKEYGPFLVEHGMS